MSERVEIACWRVWNFMRLHEKRRVNKVHPSIGVSESDYNEALELMLELNVLEKDNDGFIRLVGDRTDVPPFTAIFETRTIEGDNQ